MRRLAENPIIALLELRERRAWSPPLGMWLALLAAVYALAVAAPDAHPAVRLTVLMLGASAFPLFVAARGSRLLTSLRRGRCWEEVLGSRTSGSEMVDALALRAAATTMAASWWLGPAWVVWSTTPWLEGTPLWALVAGGLTAQVLGAWLASYLAQAGHSWSNGESDFLLRHLVVWLALAPAGAVLAATVERELAGDRTGALGLAALGLAAVCLLARQTALLGIEKYQQCRTAFKLWWGRVAGGGRRWTSWMPAGLQHNPVVFRETRCEARYVPGGWLGMVLWRHGLSLGLMGVMVHFALQGLSHSWRGLQSFMWLCLVVFLVLQTLRSAYRTVGALVDEREAGTLEPLLGTSISAREWVDGWAAVSFLPRSLENLAVGGLLVGVAGLADLSAWRFGACGLLLVCFTAASAYAGVSASAQAATRNQALDRIGVDLSAGLWLVGIFGLLLALQAPALVAPLAVLLGFGSLARYRHRALELMTTDQLMEEHASLSGLLRRNLRCSVPDGFAGRLWDRFEEQPARVVIRQGLRQAAPAGFRDRLFERLDQQGLVR